jgi:hypothetical protein
MPPDIDDGMMAAESTLRRLPEGLAEIDLRPAAPVPG